MDLMTISEVSKRFDVSTRTLRYYEQIGILRSQKKEDYAYRTYDDAAVRRLQQILILRKLRIPLKQIGSIFQDDQNVKMIEVFQQQLTELDGEIGSLKMIRTVLHALLMRLQNSLPSETDLDALQNADVIDVIQTLCLSEKQHKEEQTMESLHTACKTLSKLNDVRIIHLPPCTVAACRYVGENPEEAAGAVIEKFIQESKLYDRKPDARMFGFNSPDPSPKRLHHGYESWITIPEDMEVPAPLMKKRFGGGLYAAHTILLGNFHEWDWLREWVEHSDKYEAAYSEEGEENMSGCLEEGLNWMYYSHLGWPENHEPQLDLLLPVKAK